MRTLLTLGLIATAVLGGAFLLLRGDAPSLSDGPAQAHPDPRPEGGKPLLPPTARPPGGNGVRPDRIGTRGAIDGRVRLADGTAGREAHVRVRPWPDRPGEPTEPAAETAADSDGFFRFESVPPGDWVVTADLAGRATAAAGVRGLAAGETRTVLLALAPGRWIAGRVIDPNGSPVSGAEVRAGPSTVQVEAARRNAAFAAFPFPTSRSTRTDDRGWFRIGGLSQGLFDLTAKADGFLEGRARGLRPTVENVFVTLEPAYRIVARVKWEGDERPTRLKVGTDDGAAGVQRSGEGDELRFEIGGLPEGRHRVSAEAEGFGVDRAEVAVGPADPAPEVTLFLPAGAPVRGLVAEEFSKKPIPGATVVFLAYPEEGTLGEPIERQRATADEEGRYESRLGPGLWTARPEKDGYVPRGGPRPTRPRSRWSSPDEDAWSVGRDPVVRDLELRRDYVATGRVLWRSGKPVDRPVFVYAMNPRPLPGERPSVLPPWAQAQTGPRGEYRLTGLLPWFEYRVFTVLEQNNMDVAEHVRFEAGKTTVTVPDLTLSDPTGADTGDGAGESPPPAVVRGRIVDAEGKAIGGALVASSLGSAFTDPEGRFEITGPAPKRGEATVSALAPASPPAFLDRFTIHPGGDLDLGDLAIPANGVVVRGQVYDPERNPVPGVEIAVTFSGGEEPVLVRPDRTGTFRVEGPIRPGPAGIRVVVTARAPGYAPTVKSLEVLDESWVDVPLLPPAGVAGTFVYEGERPALVELVTRLGYSGIRRIPVPFGRSGSFSVELPEGLTLLRFEATDRIPTDLEDPVTAAGGMLDLGEVRLHRGATLLVRLVDSAGRAVAGETVRIAARANPSSRKRGLPAVAIRPGTTNAEGEVRFPHLPPGEYDVVARPDRDPASGRVAIGVDEEPSLALHLR